MFCSGLFSFAPPLPSGDAPGGVNQPVPRGRRFGPLLAGKPGHAVGLRPHRLGKLLHQAWRRHRSRNCLARMDAHLLKDIGLSYADAESEMNKPFWIA
jgi:uncharacterized protein YjiS (DUF1127 family)